MYAHTQQPRAALALCTQANASLFLQTFFSTDIVKYQYAVDPVPQIAAPSGQGQNQSTATIGNPPPDQEDMSRMALHRFLEVSLSLMVATFAFAGWWYFREKKKREQWAREIEEKYQV